jgi:phenylacetate-CoA ligase
VRILHETAVRTWARTRRDRTYQYYDAIAAALYRPRAEVEDRSLALLKKLLVYAYQNTPAYRALMDEAGLDPGRLSSPDQLSSMRITRKDDIRRAPEAYVSAGFDPLRRSGKSTSGSSGTPLAFYRDRDYVAMGRAGTMRNMAVAGWKPGEAVALIWGYGKDVSNLATLWKSNVSRTYYLNAFEQTPTTMARWVRLLTGHKIGYLYGYPSSVSEFARYVETHRIEMRIKAVFLTAEKYFPAERETIERVFHCRSYDLYGSSEVLNIAFECPRGSLHVSSDFTLVQQHPSERPDLPQLITTSFHNFCMPFIRYELGDFGRLLEQDCGCGIQTPLIEIYGGSKYDFLLTASGMVHGAILERIFQKIEGIARYQIVQHGLESYTIRVQAADNTDRALLQRQVEETAPAVMHRIVGIPVKIRYEYPSRLESGPNGKYRFIYRDS